MNLTTKVILVLSVLLVALGIALLVAGYGVAKPYYNREVVAFSKDYAPGASGKSYDQLYAVAYGFREHLAGQQTEQLIWGGGIALAVGILLLCWALDRSRLAKKVRRLSRQG